MPYYLSKILPLVVMPLTIAWVLGLLALVCLLKNYRRATVFLLVASISILWIASSPAVASRMLDSLQNQYPPIPPDEIPASDCIIVLGGAVGALIGLRVEIELYDSIDRVYQTAKLYRAGKAGTVIVAAGNQPWERGPSTEAERISALLTEWGVPNKAIKLDSQSKNTRENALNSELLARELGCERNLLVTTAWHMPRAVAAFRKAGLDVLPVAVDIQGIGGIPQNWVTRLLPDAGALATSSTAIREWLGIWVYRWRDWI